MPKIDIRTSKRSINEEHKFSILIPSWNNLPYLKLCVESIRKNSSFKHQIIVHVNEGIDGSLDWIESQNDIDYAYSKENAGVCYPLNICSQLAHTDYILYINDDMYVCPGWDKSLWKEIQAIGHHFFFLSSTAIEPVSSNACAIEGDYGRTIESFNEDLLLEEYFTFNIEDWSGATWPPNIVHKSIWDLVGGYSIEFSPGMYSDPDFSMKLWHAGVRIFKGVSTSRVYHFGSVSVNRIKKNAGYYKFISKWGLTSGIFSKYYLKRGERYNGALGRPLLPWFLNGKMLYKKLVTVLGAGR